MKYEDLDTPALMIDLDRLQSNIVRMASFTKAQDIQLRPHTKTHKCPEIAKMQLAAGAMGITCAKIGEAEVMAQAGIDDILIANEIIGQHKFKRLIDLSKKVNLCVAVDSLLGATSLNAALQEADHSLDVMIEVNCGQNRCGVLPGIPALELALEMRQLSRLNLRGLLTHGGHAYHGASQGEIEEIGIAEGTVMVETARLLRENGLRVGVISTGSTPTARYCGSVEGVTEIRPGTYVFNDLTQTSLFAATPDDCALSVLATVISRPAADRVVVDAGKKALTSDPFGRGGENRGYGLIQGKQAHISALSEEHGVIQTSGEFTIGEKVEIIPNHACVVVNMFDEMFGIRSGEVETVFKIAGRGKMN